VRKFVLVVACATLFTSPALAAGRTAVTPSGQPEGVFANTTLGDAGGKLASVCMDSGFQVTNQTPNQITCEVPLNGFKSAFTQMLIGNSYSTTPRSYVRISLAQIGGNVRIQAHAWVETQMAFGQMRQHQYSDDTTFNNLIDFLLRTGAELPHGTYFTGTYVGFHASPATRDANAFDITKVVPSGPADKAGLLVGDRLVSVNGKAFKNWADFQKKLSTVRLGANYPLIVQRDGREVTLTVLQQTRPTVGTPEYTALRAKEQASAPLAAATPLPAPQSQAQTAANTPAPE
jgi:PDZ domain